MAPKLNDKQRLFIAEYLVDLNATQAAIRAGYSQKTAAAVGHENLRKPKIASAVQEAFEKRSERTEVTGDWVLERLVENANRSMTATPVYDSEGEEVGVYTYQGAVANKALELLGKHLGMFGEKGSGVNVNVNVSQGDNAPSTADEIRNIERHIAELEGEIVTEDARG